MALDKKLSVLLATGSAGGTIAAVRNLGANDTRVSVLSNRPLSAAMWSRWASRSYLGPSETKSHLFIKRLLAIGANDPGQILLPTSDETVWLYTANADVLGRYFQLYQPPLSTICRILDKTLLAGACAKVGLAVLPSWNPCDFDEIRELAPSLPYPILIKPRTHVHRLRNNKGIVVNRAKDLLQQYQRFVDLERARFLYNPLLPNAILPMLQPFVSVGCEGVLSVTGFVDRTGEHFVTRQATKLLQRSQPVGVGVCFESVPTISGLSNSVRRLCYELNYFGMFEVEFIWHNGSWAVIDFNPRLYNQAGLDIHRGMPLPLLACLDAAGEKAALRLTVEKALIGDETTKMIFYDWFTLTAILSALTLTARISRKDRQHWRAWKKLNAAHAIDVAADISDPIPGIIHAMSEFNLGLKAVPRFLQATSRRPASLISHVIGKRWW
jgi:predicted ATP-grasp superfamily ATP-dependent carboligase